MYSPRVSAGAKGPSCDWLNDGRLSPDWLAPAYTVSADTGTDNSSALVTVAG